MMTAPDGKSMDVVSICSWHEHALAMARSAAILLKSIAVELGGACS